MCYDCFIMFTFHCSDIFYPKLLSKFLSDTRRPDKFQLSFISETYFAPTGWMHPGIINPSHFPHRAATQESSRCRFDARPEEIVKL